MCSAQGCVSANTSTSDNTTLLHSADAVSMRVCSSVTCYAYVLTQCVCTCSVLCNAHAQYAVFVCTRYVLCNAQYAVLHACTHVTCYVANTHAHDLAATELICSF